VGCGQIAELANDWDGYSGSWPATTASVGAVLKDCTPGNGQLAEPLPQPSTNFEESRLIDIIQRQLPEGEAIQKM
jgi:hypothetical protein